MSTHHDENLYFSAVLTKITDQKLVELLEAPYQLEVWSRGNLLYSRPLTKPVRAWNISRQKNSIIYLLDPEDEDGRSDVIHVLSLHDAVECDDETYWANLETKLGMVRERLVIDWTDLTSGDH